MMQQRRQSGFAMMTAMAMILLVSVTTAGLAARFALDAKLTQKNTSDAQLRQLLLAGAASWKAAPAPGSNPDASELTLPEELKREGASVTWRNESKFKVIITARHGQRGAEQTLRIEEGRIVAAESRLLAGDDLNP